MAHDAAAHVAKHDHGAERRADVDFDRRAGDGKIDDAAGIAAAVIELDLGYRVARRHAFVAAVLGQAQLVIVGKPGQLRG